METIFTSGEGSALYGLMADNTADIILKTDQQGFIVHASPAIAQLGVAIPSMLIGPHLLDLVHPSCAAAVQSVYDAAVNGRPDDKGIEISALTKEGQERWFEMRVRRLADDNDRTYGALIVMRNIDEQRSFEERLFAAEMTDPLTGLTNRKAFNAMLQHLVDNDTEGCLALLDVDHFKAINMQYGHSAGDQVLVMFANLLRNMVRSDDIISRIGSESLAVLLPGTGPDHAEIICQRIITSLSRIRPVLGATRIAVTASGGISRIGKSRDDTVKRAELALFFAKGKGCNRLEMDKAAAFPVAAVLKAA